MPKIGETLAKGVSLMNSALKYVCVGLLLFMMGLGTADVIGRYLFNNPILGTLEIFEILLPAIVLLGLGYTQENRGHVTMELLVTQLSPRTKTILEIATNACALVISVLILWRGWILTSLYWHMGRTIPTIDVPMFLPQLFVPLGALMLSLVLMVQMLENIIQLKKGN
jgi:TRAP-type C4-dicarboxylate transport system permease small subunit